MSKKLVKFSKMHGLGNDFVIINGISQSIPIEKLPIKQLANRHTGIGFDQLLVLTPSSSADFACRIFNADGGEAEQCGNGMRCVGRFIKEEKLSTQENISIELKNNSIQVEMTDFQHIKIDMGIPQFTPDYDITLGESTLKLSTLTLGNPHAILPVPSLKKLPFAEWGSKISTHSHFPAGVNVGFMQIVSPEHFLLRTFERGCGETLACGSNSCAAAVVGIKNKLLKSQVKVELPLGHLIIEWTGDGSPVYMTGPAERVFEGSFTL